jgi:hypothetical protein
MPWIVGLDEAGYGPNLGPLVQAAVGLWLEGEDDKSGWEALARVVRRQGEPADRRILVDDSKKVHHGKAGFSKLQRSLGGWFAWDPQTLGDWLDRIGLPDCRTRAEEELWFDPTEQLAFLRADRQHSAFPCQQSVAIVRVVQTIEFNEALERTGSKGTILAEGVTQLLPAILQRLPADNLAPARILCDKQGGRAYYGPMLEKTFPGGLIHADYEKPEESRYRIENLSRRLVVSFCPRADDSSVAVALASMLAKFVRELMMAQFNRFWGKVVPGLEPTAGYPVDARRYFAAIEPHLEAEGLVADQVWRRK